MKKAGIVIIIIGLLFTILTGFKYFTKEKLLDVGSVELSASMPHKVTWSPYLGVGIMIVGGVVFLLGRKNKI